MYEVCVPLNFAEYSLVFSCIIEMDKDALAIHLALEKQVKAIVTYKQYLLKEDVVLKAGSKDVVTNFIEFDVSCKFEFESDSKYSHACIGSWVTVVAIDNVAVEV